MTVRPRRATTPALAGVVLCAALLGGCAAPPQLAALRADWPGGLPDRVQVQGVPFLAQTGDRLCGPATLAMVAQAAGRTVTPETLTPQVYLPGRQGALQAEMLAAARRHSLVPVVLEPSLPALLRELASGAPVLVLQNLALPFAPQWHYAVAVGYDRQDGSISLHSGPNERLRMPLATFEHTWARSGHWAVRVVSPDAPPATADAQAWGRAVAPLERTDVAAARQAYAAGLRRWPDHALLHFGEGNAAHALGDFPGAARAFEAAARSQPDFADAWNNLARVRLSQGQPGDALRAAQRAVALGGPRERIYQDTLQAVRAADKAVP
ncbi:PA2778 family cysteine peptidase [Hydrogenophaga sp. XSHU_21]